MVDRKVNSQQSKIECGVFLLGTGKLLRRRRRWIAKHHSAAAADLPP
jgi:hypothetical protein